MIALLAVAGAVLLVDGALRGELRHRLAGVSAGLLLALPLTSVAVFGERALQLWRKVLSSALMLLVVLFSVELAARWLDLRAISAAELEPDPVLGHVRRPGRGGLDEWGFRNEALPERVDIVCVGDSQTYGANIRFEDAWPQALARCSGRTVYNLSDGGYGPLQHVSLTERALELRPRVVVVGFYFGNDLSDAHRFAGLEHWAALRDPEFSYSVPNDIRGGDTRSLNLTMALLDALEQRSRLAGAFAQRIKLQLKVNPALVGLFKGGAPSNGFEQGRISTHFTPLDRLASVDLARPVARDGLRITAICVERMQAACRARGAEFVVLLLPTKEAVYARLLEGTGDARADSLQTLYAAERAATQAVHELLRTRGVRTVDTTGALVEALRSDVACWPPNSDGHFNPQGCEVLARELWRELGPMFEQESAGR